MVDRSDARTRVRNSLSARKVNGQRMGIEMQFSFYGIAKRIAQMAIPNGRNGHLLLKIEWPFFTCMNSMIYDVMRCDMMVYDMI